MQSTAEKREVTDNEQFGSYDRHARGAGNDGFGSEFRSDFVNSESSRDAASSLSNARSRTSNTSSIAAASRSASTSAIAFADRDVEQHANALARRKARTLSRVESLYESLETVHEKLSDSAQRERFVRVTNASADARETRARSVNQAFILTQFSQFKKQREQITRDASAYVAVRSAVAANLFATESEREQIENARDASERARALHAFTSMSDVEFYERMRERISQRNARDELSNAVLARVRDAVLKSRDYRNVDALALYRAARSEIIDTDSGGSADLSSNAASKSSKQNAANAANTAQLSASELDVLRSRALAIAQQTRDDLSEIDDAVEMLLRVYARERKSGTVDETEHGAFDYTSEGAFERLAQFDDAQRSLIYHTLALRASDAPETERSRSRGAVRKLYEKTKRRSFEIRDSHIESFKQSALSQRVRIAEQLREFTSVDDSGTLRVRDDDASKRAMNAFLSREGGGSRYGIRTLDDVKQFIENTQRDEHLYRVGVELKSVVDSTIDSTDFENKWINALAEAPGQLGFMLEGMVPYVGIVLIANTTKAMRTQELIMRGVSLAQAESIATVSAVPEAFIERLQLGILKGKGGMLSNLVTEPTRKDLAKRAGAFFATEFVTQNVQELAQDATPLAIQHVASLLSDKVPETTIEDWKELGAQTPETAMTLLPLVLFGTGAGVSRDRRIARQYLANVEGWRAVGFSEEVVGEITELVRRDKLGEAQALVKAQWDKRALHNEEQLAALAALEERLREAGEAVAQHNITLRADGVFEVRDRRGELVDEAATPEAAFELAVWVEEREQLAEAQREERERADYVAWYEGELERREAEVAGFEWESERAREREELERRSAHFGKAATRRLEQHEQAIMKQADALGDEYAQQLAQAREEVAEGRSVSRGQVEDLGRKREAAFELLDKRARALEATGGTNKSTREYNVALARAQRADDAYAVGLFTYAQQIRAERMERMERRERALSGGSEQYVELATWRVGLGRGEQSFVGQKPVTKPDGPGPSARIASERKAQAREEAAQAASNNAAGDVGARTAAGLSKQAADMLERVQERGVLGMPIAQEGAAQVQRELSVSEKGVSKAEAHTALFSLRGKLLRNEETGIEAQINTNQAGKLLSAAAVKKSIDNGFTHEQHNALVAKVKALWSHAIQIEEYVDERGGDKKTTIKRFSVPVLIGGKLNYATILAKESVKHGHRIYTLEVHAEKTLRGILDKPLASEDGSVFTPTRSVDETLRRLERIVKGDSQAQANPVNSTNSLGSPAALGSSLGLGYKNHARVSFEGEAAEAGSPLAKRKGPVSAPEVLEALERVIEAVGRAGKALNRVGHMRGKHGGHFELHSKVTRMRTANDLPVAIHEMAHALDNALWGSHVHWEADVLGLGQQARSELFRLGKDLYGEKVPHNGYHSEGFAEFVRLWLGDRQQAHEKAPAFAQWFEGQVSQNRQLAKALAQAQALATRYFRQGAEARAAGGIARREAALVQAWKWLGKNSLYWIEEKWIDSAAAVRRFAKEAAKGMGMKELPAHLDPYLSLVGSRMTPAAVVHYMANHGMLDFARNKTGGVPLVEAFTLAGGKEKSEQFIHYLWARRTLALGHDERNGPRNSGMDAKDAAHLVEKHERENPQFMRAAGIVYSWNAGVLDYAAQASPAFAETVKKIREADPGSYLPLQREFTELDNAYAGAGGAGGAGGSSAARAQVSKRLRGSGRRIKDPVESMMAQAHDLILKAHQRRIIDQMLELSQRVPGLGHHIVEIPVDHVPAAHASLAQLLAKVERGVGTGGALKRAIKDAGHGDLLKEMTSFFAPATQPKKGEPHVFAVWERGRTRWYEVDEHLYTALSGIDSPKMGPFLRLAALPARVVRLGTTGLRPSFSLVTNALRDFNTLVMNSRTSANPGELLFDWLQLQKDAFLNAVTGGKVDNPWIDLSKRLGLEMAQPLGQDTLPLERAGRRVKNGGKFDALKFGDYYDFLLELLQFTELGSRVTELKRLAKDKNWDPSMPMTAELMLEFSRAGKQVTTDFTQAGKYARWWNQVIPFLNAGIQGPVAHYRALRRDPVKFTTRGLMLTALALSNWYRNRDEEWWKQMPLSERYRHTYIPLPNGDLLRLPRAFESDGLFMAGAEAIVDAWYAKEPKAVVEWFGQWASSFAPPVAPAVVKPAIEIGFNKDFFRGREIVPRWQQDRPAAEQYGPYTSRVAIKLGEWFGQSPRMIDHAIRGHFGGVGADLAGLLGRGNNDLVERDWEASDLPIWGVLFQRGGQRAGQSKSVDAMYAAYGEALQRQNSIRHEETPEERQQRLMLTDAVKAVGIYADVQLITKSKEVRAKLESERIKVSSEVVELLKAGEFDRSVSGRALGEARATQWDAIEEGGLAADARKSRPIRDAIHR